MASVANSSEQHPSAMNCTDYPMTNEKAYIYDCNGQLIRSDGRGCQMFSPWICRSSYNTNGHRAIMRMHAPRPVAVAFINFDLIGRKGDIARREHDTVAGNRRGISTTLYIYIYIYRLYH